MENEVGMAGAGRVYAHMSRADADSTASALEAGMVAACEGTDFLPQRLQFQVQSWTKHDSCATGHVQMGVHGLWASGTSVCWICVSYLLKE